jgi:hypothetical protein
MEHIINKKEKCITANQAETDKARFRLSARWH